MTALLPAALIVIMALLGAPLFVVILAAAFLGFHLTGVPMVVVASEIHRIATTPLLMALPLFTLAGYLLGESQTSRRMVRLANAFLGWMPGGVGIMALVACALFTAFTGASGVTIVALGALLHPVLIQSGYKERFSLGLITSSGSLGLLFPPSVPLILFGIIAQQMNVNQVEINDLFLAGIAPGLLMLLMLAAWTLWDNRTVLGNRQPFSAAEAWAAVREAAWEIPLPIFILGGIYGGFIAVSEAAAATALYVLLVEVLVYREIPLKKVPGLLRDSMVMVGGILLILGASLAFTNFLVDAQAPMKLFAFMQGHISSRFVFLILLNIFLLVLGAILDIFSALVIMVPLLLPVAMSYGVNPLHLGIVFLANMQIGYFTPPVGMNLFIASYRFDREITELYRACLPFMAVLLLAVLIITYWPGLCMVFL